MMLMMVCGCDFFVSTQARMARAEQASAESNYGLAAIEYRNVLRSKPDDLTARFKLVDVLLRAGDINDAAAELESVPKQSATQYEAQDLSARIYLARGDAKGLIEAMESGRIKLQASIQSLRTGQALLALSRADEAIAAFNEALRADPKADDAHIGIAQALAAAGRDADASAELDKLLAAKPGLARAWLVRGYLHARRGRAADAENAFLKAREHANGQLGQSEYAGLFASLIDGELARADIAAARASLQELIAVAPNTPTAILADARISLAAGDAADAASKLQKLSATRPDFVPARLLLSRALIAQEHFEQADSLLSQLAAEAPGNLSVRKLLAQTKLRLNSPAKALEVLAAAGTEISRDVELNGLAAAAVSQTAKSAGEIAALESDVRRAPADTGLRALLARTYLAANQAANAIDLLRKNKAQAEDPASVKLLLAAVASVEGKPGVRTESDRLVAANLQNIPVLAAIAEFLISQREFDKSGEVLNAALARQPQNLGLLFIRARLNVATGDLQAASLTLQKILSVDRSNALAYMQLAQLSQQQSNAAEAVRWLEEAREQNKTAIEPRLMLVEAYLHAQQGERADRIAKEIASLAAGRSEVENSLGELQLRASRYAQALELFNQASRERPKNSVYRLNIARAQLGLGNFPAAQEAVTQSLSLAPGDLNALRLASLVEIKAGDPQGGLNRALAYRKANEDLPGAMLLEGDVRMELRQFAEAAAAYEEAFAKLPSRNAAVQAYRARASARLPDAAASLERWLAVHPDDWDVRTIRAQALQDAGQRQQAIAEYERIIAAQPNDVTAMNNLAWLYHEINDSRAESLAKSAYRQMPQAAAIGDTYGWILLEAGKSAEALKILAAAAANVPDQPVVQYHYAAALAKAGRATEARTLLTAVLHDHAAFPAREDAEKILGRLP